MTAPADSGDGSLSRTSFWLRPALLPLEQPAPAERSLGLVDDARSPQTAGTAAAAAPAAPVDAPAAESPAAAPKTFAGLWESTFGAMELVIDGERVSGSYALGGGSTIAGRLSEDGMRLDFTYVEHAATGEGWFVLDESQQAFSGKWRVTGSTRWLDWFGRRAGAGRTGASGTGDPWLIILEANWEMALAEPQYNFGSMLQQYFTMAPARHVRVRHRFFHDAADFRRLAGEAAAMSEPVVLLISSHGTERGISSPGGVIGADVIAQTLRNGKNIVLLHLSGCMMMSGDVPAAVHAALPEETTFPISGYRAAVPWDASAISDFIYLSFLLIHRMPASDAAAQSILTAPYLGDRAPSGSLFPPLGLSVLERRAKVGDLAATATIQPPAEVPVVDAALQP